MTKSIEIYFYLAYTAWFLTRSGQPPESFSINLIFVVFNEFKTTFFHQFILILCLVLALACVTVNFKVLRVKLNEKLETNTLLINYINQKLQDITNSKQNRIQKVNLIGWLEPTVNTGAWTLYKNPDEAVIIKVSRCLALRIRLYAMSQAILFTALKWFVPLLLALSMGAA